jgi:hypothetical protein
MDKCAGSCTIELNIVSGVAHCLASELGKSQSRKRATLNYLIPIYKKSLYSMDYLRNSDACITGETGLLISYRYAHMEHESGADRNWPGRRTYCRHSL